MPGRRPSGRRSGGAPAPVSGRPAGDRDAADAGHERIDLPRLHARLLGWYAANGRDLPWRSPGTPAWGVLVSEVMLQQTPVSRVLPAWLDWMHRWPVPAALAVEPAGEAIRAWGRLGYPRRALRLHEVARTLVARHAGEVPSDLAELRALPGVGEYTARAVAAFAFGQPVAVVDTNVRRVQARLLDGRPHVPATTAAAWRRAERLLPAEPHLAARWSVAVMELGALVCQARAPRCVACPVAEQCAWRAAGQALPESGGRAQAYAGTDRQVRGRLLAVLRAAPVPVDASELARAWHDPAQRARALSGLLDDGLVVAAGGGRYRLP